MQKCDLLLPAAMIFQRCWVLLLAMAAIILGSKFWLISVFGSPTPFEDQWDAEAAWLFKPYVEGTLRIGDLLAPHNEHRCLWTRLLGLALLELNGRWGPIIEMTINALVHVGSGCDVGGPVAAPYPCALGVPSRKLPRFCSARLPHYPVQTILR